MPLILGPLREAYPQLTVELWEDVTASLLDRLRKPASGCGAHRNRNSGIRPNRDRPIRQPFLAALPPNHRLTSRKAIHEADLSRDLLALANVHCLAGQARAACDRKGRHVPQRALQAASLETLANLVAAGYGTTLVPELSASSMERGGVILRPLVSKASRNPPRNPLHIHAPPRTAGASSGDRSKDSRAARDWTSSTKIPLSDPRF
jgi:LysR family hydrogen peroxide-inducible transcriptional activator